MYSKFINSLEWKGGNLQIFMLSSYNDSNIYLYRQRNDDHDELMLVSPSIPKEHFLEAVLFLLSLVFPRIKSIYEGWEEQSKKFIDFAINDAFKKRAKKIKDEETQFSSLINRRGVLTRSMTAAIQNTTSKAIIKHTSGIEINNALIFDHSLNELIRSNSNWTKKNFSACGLVYKALFQVNKNAIHVARLDFFVSFAFD